MKCWTSRSYMRAAAVDDVIGCFLTVRRLTYLTGARLDTVGHQTGSFSPHSWTSWGIHFHPFEAKTRKPSDRGEHQCLWHGLKRCYSFTFFDLMNWWNTLDLLNRHKGWVNSLRKVETCFGQSPTDTCRVTGSLDRRQTRKQNQNSIRILGAFGDDDIQPEMPSEVSCVWQD